MARSAKQAKLNRKEMYAWADDCRRIALHAGEYQAQRGIPYEVFNQQEGGMAARDVLHVAVMIPAGMKYAVAACERECHAAA